MKTIPVILLAAVLCCSKEPVVESSDPTLSVNSGLILKDGKPFSGIVRSYIPATDEVELTAYRLGLQHGMTRKESSSGTRLAEWPYYAGAKHGVHRTWDRKGNLRSQAEFKLGSYSGESWAWYEGGKPYEYRRYSEKGELMVVRRWRPTGQIYLNQTFKNGLAIGMPGSKLCDPTEAEKIEARRQREDL